MWKKLISHPKRLYFAAAVIVMIGVVVTVIVNSRGSQDSQDSFQQTQDQQMFYRMNQALGFLSMYVQGRCPGGLQKAKGLMHARYNRHQNREMWDVLRKVMRLLSLQDQPALSDIQGVQEELRRIQTQRNYVYEPAWEQEYENCVLR